MNRENRNMARILLVDDEESVRYALGKCLRRAGHVVVEAADGSDALRQCELSRFDLVITDIIMPGVEGMELIAKLIRRSPDLPVVAISGGGRVDREEYLSMAAVLGAAAILAKPVEPDALLELTERLLKACADQTAVSSSQN